MSVWVLVIACSFVFGMSEKDLSKPVEDVKTYMIKDFRDHKTSPCSIYCNIMCLSMAKFSLGMKLRPGTPKFHSCCSWSVTTAHFVFTSGIFLYFFFFFKAEYLQLRNGQMKHLKYLSFSLGRQTGSRDRLGSVCVAGEEQGNARADKTYSPWTSPE